MRISDAQIIFNRALEEIVRDKQRLGIIRNINWRARRDLNPQPFDPKSNALSVELRALALLMITADSQSPFR